MRRVYQLFRCCLLIKQHQTLSLLTINTLLHYRAFSPLIFFLLSFPLSLWVSHSLPPSAGLLPPPFFLFFQLLSLYQTAPPPLPTPLYAVQINYLMHLSLSAGAQSNLPRSPFTDAFSHIKKKVVFDSRKGNFFFSVILVQRKGFFFFFVFFTLFLSPSLSLISLELIKLPSMCCKRLICWFPRQT